MHTRIKNYMLLEEIYRQANEGDIDAVLKDIINNYLNYPDVERLVTNKRQTDKLLDKVYVAVTSEDVRREKDVLALLQANELPYIAYLSDIGRHVLRSSGAEYLDSLPVEKKILFLDIEKVVLDYDLRSE